MELIDPKAVDLVSQEGIGDIIICGACLAVNVVTITGTRLLSEDEFAELSPDEKRDLDFAKRAVKRNFRN